MRRSIHNSKAQLDPIKKTRIGGLNIHSDTEDLYRGEDSQGEQPGNFSVREDMQQKRKPIIWHTKKEKNRGQSQSVVNPNEEKPGVNKSVDYLKEIRLKRDQDERDGVVKRKTNDEMLDKYLNDPNLNDYERLEIVRRKAEMMEQKARRDEMLIKVGKSGEGRQDVDKTIAVNDMYIEAITAKLRILDQI